MDVGEFFDISGFAFVISMDHYMPRVLERNSLSANDTEEDIDLSSVSDFSGDDHLTRSLVTDTSVAR